MTKQLSRRPDVISRLPLFSSFIASTFLLSTAVADPDKPQKVDAASKLEHMVVVATRTQRSKAEIPHSVGVLDLKDLALAQAQDLGDLLGGVNHVELLGGPRAGAENLVIRGLGGISGTRVTLLIDGARQGLDRGVLSRLNVDPSLLKSVEVLRGPASLLYGSGAIGGVVALNTKNVDDLLAPEQSVGGRLRHGYQDANEGTSTGAAVFGRMGEFDLLLDYNKRKQDDFRQGGGHIMPYSGQDSDGDLIKLRWFPGSQHELSLSSTGYRSSTLSLGNPQQPVTETNVPRNREVEQRFTGLRYGFTANNSSIFRTVQLQLNHSDYEAEETRLEPPSESTVPVAGGDALIGMDNSSSPPQLYEVTSQGANVLTTWELPWFERWDGWLSVGADYAHDEGRARAGGEPINNFPDAEQTIAGIFLQQELQANDALNLVGGVRFDQYRNTPADYIGAEDKKESATSFQLGATWAFTEQWSLAGLYGEAFRAPSLRESYSFGTHFLGNEFVVNPDLKPERAANKELSLRYLADDGLWLFDTFSADLTGFQNDVKDFMELIVTVEVEGPFPPAVQCLPPFPAKGCINQNNPTAPPIFIGGQTTTVNLPDARLRGAELEMQFSIDWFEAGVKYAMVRGEDKATGEPLSAIPADSFAIDVGGRFGSIYSGLTVTHTFEQDRVPPPKPDRMSVSTPSDGYTVVNWRALWTPRTGFLEGANLALAVDNVTDKRYRNHLTFHESHYEVGRNIKASVAIPF